MGREVKDLVGKKIGRLTVIAMSEQYKKTKIEQLKSMPPIKPQEPKTGYCEDCKYFHKLPYHADTLGKCVNHWGFCPKGDWYCADFEPQESEDKE